jgi:FkbM family methyltransferase
MSLRSLAEHFSRGIVLRRRLPRDFGRLPMYVTPEAGLRYWRRDLAKVDPMLLRMARELVKPGSVVWDIGANVGLFSFAAAALAGPSGFVLALEPDVWLAQLLNRSATEIRAASAAPVTVVCAAAHEALGIGRLSIAARARAANHLLESDGSTQSGGQRQIQCTVTVSADSLLDHFPAPSVLKIDVEGAEVKVFNGARKLLETAQPVIWCEVDPKNSVAVAEQLTSQGYVLYAAAVERAMRKPLQRASWDTLAEPASSRAIVVASTHE